MQFIPWRSKRVRSYLDLTIKFHGYSSYFTAFNVASKIANINNITNNFNIQWTPRYHGARTVKYQHCVIRIMKLCKEN